MQEEITGTINDWVKSGQVIYGKIYGDTRGRFPDGTQIRTSKIDSIEGDIVYTQNSVYKLGNYVGK